MSLYGEVGTGSCMYWYVLLCTCIFHSYLQCYSGSDGLWCVQDTIIVIPPYPYSIEEEIDDVPFNDCWYARPQLFFQCHLRPAGGRPPKNPSYKIGPDDLLFNLVFFQHIRGADLAHSWTNGECWSAQTGLAWPYSVPLCGSS